MTLITTLFEYDFMQHAFIAGTLAAILAGVVGYFVVLRSATFAGHALSHIGFAGAAGAGLIGLTAPMGQLILSVFAGAGIGYLSPSLKKSDIAIGIVLSFSLGLGVLFLSLYNAYNAQAINILFGDILGVSSTLLYQLFWLTLTCLILLACIARPLLFTSLEPEIAEAKGLSLSFLSVLFFILVAIAVTVASQIVGILLVFALLVGPAAASLNWTRGWGCGIMLSVFLALISVWVGLTLTYFTNWPATFWISTISVMIYLLSQI